jgi:HlyD family secretion protein
MSPLVKKLGICLGGLIAVGAAGGWYWHHNSSAGVTFRTEAVTRGDLMPTISASGTVEPQEVIDVGAQIEGQILYFGKDVNGKLVDYGSLVDHGTLLAKIDDSLYTADADNAAATLQQAKAGVTKAVADLGQMKAKLDQAASDWERAQKLGPSDALSQSDYNTYKANYEVAVANVGDDEAAIEQAKATVAQSEAALKKAQQSLAYCTITSPVKGIIIDRRVTIGETVVSSLNTPSLFLIAKDLTQIQVWVSVNEADIGEIHPGQRVTFTVDAYPGQTFEGTVGKVRLNATMTQNVVTYTVEVDTDNADGKLLPYLTANVQFEVAHFHDSLLVPNAALRWYPEPEMVAPDVKAALAAKSGDATAGESDAAASPEPAPTTQPAHSHHKHNESGENSSRGTVWILDGEYVRPVSVRIGSTDGIETQVLSSEDDQLKEGVTVVEGEIRAHDAATTTNPFAPQLFRGGRH